MKKVSRYFPVVHSEHSGPREVPTSHHGSLPGGNCSFQAARSGLARTRFIVVPLILLSDLRGRIFSDVQFDPLDFVKSIAESSCRNDDVGDIVMRLADMPGEIVHTFTKALKVVCEKPQVLLDDIDLFIGSSRPSIPIERYSGSPTALSVTPARHGLRARCLLNPGGAPESRRTPLRLE